MRNIKYEIFCLKCKEQLNTNLINEIDFIDLNTKILLNNEIQLQNIEIGSKIHFEKSNILLYRRIKCICQAKLGKYIISSSNPSYSNRLMLKYINLNEIDISPNIKKKKGEKKEPKIEKVSSLLIENDFIDFSEILEKTQLIKKLFKEIQLKGNKDFLYRMHQYLNKSEKIINNLYDEEINNELQIKKEESFQYVKKQLEITDAYSNIVTIPIRKKIDLINCDTNLNNDDTHTNQNPNNNKKLKEKFKF